MFCGKYTGIYSITLIRYLTEKAIDIWMEPSIQIKYSKGVTRGKDDKIDAKNNALYAYRFQDQAKLYCLPTDVLSGLKDMMTYRKRLVKVKKTLSIPADELKKVKQYSHPLQFA